MIGEVIKYELAEEIRKMLFKGPMPSAQVKKTFMDKGYSKSSITRAATIAGVTYFYPKGESYTLWRIDD